MKAKRQSTVEPVFGTLKEFMGLRKINTLGIDKANKCMHLAAIAYNLKKYLKFIKKTPVSQVGVAFSCISSLKSFLRLQISRLEPIYKARYYNIVCENKGLDHRFSDQVYSF